MKDLLRKEHYCNKIHALLMKNSAYIYYTYTKHILHPPQFLQEDFDPPFYNF